MKYLYVPEEYIQALKAAGVSVDNGESVDILTNVVRLVDILSPEDVAFYWYLNVSGNGALPHAVTASLQPALTAVGNPPALEDTASPKLRQMIEKFRDYSLNKSAPFHPSEGKQLTAALLNDEIVVFSHLDCDACSELDAYDGVIATLHAVMKFDELAALPLFQEFLTQLRQANRS